MICGFNISELDWHCTPSSIRIAAVSLQHQLFLLTARYNAHQQQLATFKAAAAEAERLRLAQAAELERLTAEVARLKERLRQNSANSNLPPSSDSPFLKRTNNAQPSGRKQGGQGGHLGTGRYLLEVDQVDKVIELRASRCASCGSCELAEDWRSARRQVTEITVAGTVLTEYQRLALRCQSCGQRNRVAWPEEAMSGAFGARLKATIAYLTGRLNLSHRDVVEALDELFEVQIGVGSIAAVQKRISNALSKAVSDFQQLVENAPGIYVDETTWREKNKQPWLWVSASEQATVFQVLAGRKTTEAQTIIGENTTGIITTDRYLGYNYLDRYQRQICWAHLKRDFAAIAEREGDSKEIGERLLKQTKYLFELWGKVRDGTLTRTAFELAIEPLKRQVNQLLMEGTTASHSKTRNTCRNILKLESSLWTFIKVEAVEPTNNHAERALRRAVLWRRKSFGTQSESGSRFVERILTVVTTLGQQRRSVLEFLTATGRERISQQSA